MSTDTMTEENTTVDFDSDDNDENDEGENQDGRGRKRDRDFTKYRPLHAEIAEYVNTHSGLDAVSPNQIKAILTLRSDFANSPEQVAAREARKAEREAENQKYAGMSEDQIKAAKAAKRAEDQAAKLRAKAEEQMERARALVAAAEGSGEDLAALVSKEESKPKGRRARR